MKDEKDSPLKPQEDKLISEPKDMKDDNVLIAEFMGWQIDNSFPDKGRVWRAQNGNVELASTMKFDTSWDWLIPVVRKIITMTSATNIGEICIEHRKDAICKCGIIRKNLSFADVDSVYHSVVQFIEHYNSQTNEK